MHKRYNFWFIKQQDVDNIDTLPVGIYFVIPQNFTNTISLSHTLEALLDGAEMTDRDKAILTSAVINATEEEQNRYVDLGINHISAWKFHCALVWGKNIITDIDNCTDISTTKVTISVLQQFIDHHTLSSIREYISLKHQEREITYWYYNYLREMIKTLMTNNAVIMLLQLDKALYIQGDY